MIFYGKSGDLASNRRDEHGLAVLSLHLLQAALVLVNTLMIQTLLAEPEWGDALTGEDERGLTRFHLAHHALRRGQAGHVHPARPIQPAGRLTDWYGPLPTRDADCIW